MFKTIKFRLTVLAALFINVAFIQAQEFDTNVINDNFSSYIIKLKSGTTIAGNIIEWIPDSHITLKTSWSDSFTLDAKKIKNVKQQKLDSSIGNRLYTFKGKGIYYTARAQVIGGNNGDRARKRFGYGLSTSAGYRFNRFYALGAGIGYDQFIYDSGENFIPLFAEFTSYLNKRPTSLAITMQAGYSLALTNEDFLLTEARGGLFIYPAIGLRFGSGPTSFTMDIGCKIQKANLTYADAWDINSSSAQALTYRRLCLRFGILL